MYAVDILCPTGVCEYVTVAYKKYIDYNISSRVYTNVTGQQTSADL